jgi:hypothetical protein
MVTLPFKTLFNPVTNKSATLKYLNYIDFSVYLQLFLN